MKTLCNDQVGIKESVAELITTGLRRRDGITLAAWQEASSTFIILECTCICICILDIFYIRYRVFFLTGPTLKITSFFR